MRLSAADVALAGNGYDGLRRTVDVSGDGRNNDGSLVADARDVLVSQGVQVNGLAILNEDPATERFYRKEVIGGPGSFVIRASDYSDFARAIRLKLIREISGGAISTLNREHDEMSEFVR